MTNESHAPKDTIQSLQILRFLAALVVVLDHCKFVGAGIADHLGLAFEFPNFHGRLGVDIFFIISGFIMVFISSDRDAWSSTPMAFISDRVSRIVPIYYLAILAWTTLFFGSAYLNGRYADVRWSTEEYIKSFLFIPYYNPATKLPQPVLPQGWTLNYEMFFYFLFSCALVMKRSHGIVLIFAIFVVLVGIGQIWDRSANEPFVLTRLAADPKSYFVIPRFWFDPIILEFLAGVGLALLRDKLKRMNAFVKFRYSTVSSITIIALYTYIYNSGMLAEAELDYLRALCAVGTVSICVLTNDAAPNSVSRELAVAFGNASYSLYLFHVHVLFIMSSLWKRLGSTVGMSGFVPFSVMLCIIASVLSYRIIERPLSRFVRRVLHERVSPLVILDP